MNKNIIIILITIFSLPVLGQEKCENFKVGTFKFLDKDYEDLVVVRNDSVEISTYKSFKCSYTSKVEWLTDCRYRTTIYKVDNAEHEILIGQVFTIEISEISGNKIVCKHINEISNTVVEKVMIKID